MDNKGVPGFIGMALIGFVLCLMLVGGAWLLVDGTNADIIAPMPTPFAEDVNSDVITMGVENIDHQVAMADEITDLARDVSNNQLRQAEDATGAVAAVAVAGYASNTAIVTSYNFRDIGLVFGAALLLFLIWQIKKSNQRGER